ncbi:prolyl oligopeptidase family serine peptidase [Amnibacterium sp. CER49]|uniref:S9 family peptidase n=1 Tax=Amnibacterium sp. CER49 TaxID=3039161 RepID=UPI002447AB2B|nr:prolyl oligopeptidase family serine peptidase [Amnibacterium sp. CER49]MDH2442361.1 prolyl oligopeptidase family serine peptidase [Amnibacterium sp. CER49]
MTGSIEAPYGEWRSPLTAADVAEGAHQPVEAAYVGDEIWWTEPIPGERRITLHREGPDGAEVLLPAPWNIRSRVHEYGGGAWAAGEAGVAFVRYEDQRLHRFDGAGTEPVPLTPDGLGMRFGGLSVVGSDVLAVRETHVGEGPGDLERDVVLVPLDGSAADDPGRITSVVGGSRFLAQPRISPDGGSIAWIAWDHPDMPWDGTELRVARLEDGRATGVRTLLGHRRESVVQPEWLDDATLAVCSDRTGWWNLYRVAAAGGEPEPLHPEERETGGALWVLGLRWYLPLPDGRFLLTSTLGADEQALLDPSTGEARVLRERRSYTDWQAQRQGRALLIDQAAGEPGALRELDVATGVFRVVRAGVEGLPLEVFPEAELHEVDGVHAVVYRPRNPAYTAPEGTLPPFVAFVHGGPTTHVGPQLSAKYAYYTSRGIGVVDIDYGGSTGYGRAYRERLNGQWGVVDVADVVTVVRGLGARGIADPERLAIEGGSAGGWTVLAALTTTDVFACGASFYGVADAVAIAADTHDFEAHYTDGLIGPYPEAAATYAERAPINHVDGLRVPVLLLQGADDPVVPPAQSRTFRDALAARGILHAYLEFEGESHGFRGRDALVASREACLSFYGQVLGFTPPGVPVLPLER